MSRRSAASRMARNCLFFSTPPFTVPVRSLWNNCLQPSLNRCQCARQPLGASNNRLTARYRASTTYYAAHASHSTARRLFSSPALSSSPSPSPLLPPLPSSVPLTDAIELTDAAARRIGELRGRHGPNMYLRLSVDSGGCSGLSYKFEIDKHGQQPDDLSAPRTTTTQHNTYLAFCCHSQIRLAYRLCVSCCRVLLCSVFTHGPGSVLVDNLSLGMLRGSLIDYRVRLERSGFEVVNNPNAAGKCGCGTSFQPKSF